MPNAVAACSMVGANTSARSRIFFCASRSIRRYAAKTCAGSRAPASRARPRAGRAARAVPTPDVHTRGWPRSRRRASALSAWRPRAGMRYRGRSSGRSRSRCRERHPARPSVRGPRLAPAPPAGPARSSPLTASSNAVSACSTTWYGQGNTGLPRRTRRRACRRPFPHDWSPGVAFEPALRIGGVHHLPDPVRGALHGASRKSADAAPLPRAFGRSRRASGRATGARVRRRPRRKGHGRPRADAASRSAASRRAPARMA